MNLDTQLESRGRVQVDPRLRERRIEVTRHQGRRRLRVLLAVTGLVAVLGAGWGVTRSALLDVDRVVVEGAARTGPEQVLATAGVHEGQVMTVVDEGEAARRLARLSWVEKASVRREWPATVRIRLVERTAAAVIADGTGGWVEVDATGRVLTRRPAEAGPGTALPVVEMPPPGATTPGAITPGPVAPGGRLSPPALAAVAVAAALPPSLTPRVAAVAVAGDGVELRLKPQGTVRLGTPEAVDAKLRAALSVLGAVDGRTLATLDVRRPEAPVLTRR